MKRAVGLFLILSFMSYEAIAKDFFSESVKTNDKTEQSKANYEQSKVGTYRDSVKNLHEGTICFSPIISDTQKLRGGKCENRTTEQMYADGWRLVQVITGLNSEIGFLFERPIK